MNITAALCKCICTITVPRHLTAPTIRMLGLLLLAMPAAIQGQFTFITNSDAIAITGYTGPGDAVVIPSATNGYPVTSVWSNAFCSSPNVTDVLIPSSVTNLCDYAFANCTNLAMIFLNGNAPTANSTVFSNDTATLYYVPGTTGWSSPFAGLVAKPTTPQAQFNYTTNGGTVVITRYTGSRTSVIIPPIINGLRVTAIGDAAFFNQPTLLSVVIPTSVTSIGNEVFEYCTALTNVVLGGCVTSIGNYAFNNCSPLPSVVLPNSVTSIGNNAFYYCMGLSNVTLGSGVTSIGHWAFSTSLALRTIVIPRSVTYFGVGVFYACTSLTNITVDSSNPAYSSFGGVLFDKSQATLLQFPGGLIGEYTVSNNVTRIETWAFGYCTNLTSVTLGSGLISIGNSGFYNCYALRSIKIPDNVTGIEGQGFYNCRGLTNVCLGTGLTDIADYNFWGCSALRSIVIPDSVTAVGQQAFIYCTNLMNVTLGRSVSTIRFGAFAYCSALANIVIPSRVTRIGQYAFEYCSALEGVYFGGGSPTPEDDYTVFSGSTSAVAYYLPGSTGWSTTFDGVPAVMWNPEAQTTGAIFGVRTNRFGFIITGTEGIPVVVEACTNLGGCWTPLLTCTITNGSIYFSDAQWTNYINRYYRIRSP